MKQSETLIVDDEQRYADMLARRLGLRGIECTVRYDGQTAVDTVAEKFFPLTILDLRLPDMYGTDVLIQIKKRWPSAEVVILTGHGTDLDRERCMAEGALAFFNKPADIDRLVQIANQIKEKSE